MRTYNLGELVFNGIPAYPTVPPRTYDQRLVVLGYQPPAGLEGYLQSPAPAGPNLLSAHEERFKVPGASVPPGAADVYAGTYQVATQLDNFNHIGVGPVFYGVTAVLTSPRRGAPASWSSTRRGPSSPAASWSTCWA